MRCGKYISRPDDTSSRFETIHFQIDLVVTFIETSGVAPMTSNLKDFEMAI